MVFPTIMPANSVSGGYEISNSLRFNDGDSSKLTFTPDGAGDRDTFTFSFWIKRTTSGAAQRIFSAGTSIGTNNNNVSSLLFESNDTLKFFGEVGGSASFNLQTNRLFRDPSAWYHIVVAVDTEDGTAANRIKLYVNGVQESSFGTATYMGQNTDTFFNAANLHNISYAGGGGFVDGYLAEFHHIDGTQVAPTDFGEFDDNGVWIPKAYTGSYGTNGFYLQFKETGTGTDASGIGADTSGNDNHFAVTNFAATDVTTDTPTNTFCTWNPLDKHSGQTLSEGNTKNVAANSAGTVTSTIGVSEGKWYFEYKVKVVNAQSVFAIPQNLYNRTTDSFQSNFTTGLYYSNPSIYRNGSNVVSNLNGTISANDIIMWAMDLDNNNIYFGKGGNWTDGNGFDQSDFANATAYPLTRDSNDSFIVISTHNGASASSYTLEMNWGNPPYAVSSSNTDGKYGNFEFAPPSGYYALCSKRIAEFG